MDNKIKVGLCSFGMSGKVFHGPFLKVHPGFFIRKILERSKNLSEDLYPGAAIVRDLDNLLNDKGIDLIVVNTPDNTHASYVRKALEAGKHVIVEKPFVQHTGDGERLVTMAEEKGLVLTVFQNRRWDSDFLTVKKVLDSKVLGRLVELESHFHRYRNYIQPNTWKEEKSAGTGLVYNLGSHLIDQALCLFGKPGAVYADIRIIRDNGEVDDFFEIDLMYPDQKVKLKSSYLVRENGPRFILHGTHGSFLKWGTDPQEDNLKKGVLPNSVGWGEEEEKYRGLLNAELDGINFKGQVETLPGNYMAFYDGVYDAIVNKKPVPVDPRDSLLGIKIIESAFESSQNGKKVPL